MHSAAAKSSCRASRPHLESIKLRDVGSSLSAAASEAVYVDPTCGLADMRDRRLQYAMT